MLRMETESQTKREYSSDRGDFITREIEKLRNWAAKLRLSGVQRERGERSQHKS